MITVHVNEIHKTNTVKYYGKSSQNEAKSAKQAGWRQQQQQKRHSKIRKRIANTLFKCRMGIICDRFWDTQNTLYTNQPRTPFQE